MENMLEIRVTRTANAGVLLEMDGTSILLDGVCEPLPPYLGTPKAIRDRLTVSLPDVVAFTHKHTDHYDASYAQSYREKTLRSVIGPESLPFYEAKGGIGMSLVETRHIGKTDLPHVSYIIEGSACVWFMGDASPLVLKNLNEYPRPDLLIVPFAYATTPSAWRSAKETGARKILLLHMPPESEDREGIWNMVRNTTADDEMLCMLDIGETVSFKNL